MSCYVSGDMPSEDHRRSHKACLNCRKRKIRCVFTPESEPNGPCVRCVREKVTCEVPKISRRGGIRNVLAGREKQRKRDLLRREIASKSPEVAALRKELYSIMDALEILSRAARSSKGDDGATEDEFDNSGDLVIGETLIVDGGLVQPAEIRSLVVFFAENMSWYVPFLPLDTIASERMLLPAVLCIASQRYIPDANMSTERLQAIHLAMFEQCKQQTPKWWDGIRPVRGAIFALLLLVEWLPDALSDELIQGWPKGDKRLWPRLLRQNARMSWLLLGEAAKLAEDTGLVYSDHNVYVALQTLEHVVSCRLGRTPVMNPTVREQWPENLTISEKARLGISSILHVGFHTLYSSRQATRTLIDSGRYMTLLELMNQNVQKWLIDYRHIAESDDWSMRSIMFEFNHATLYVFSLALMSHQYTRPSSAKLLSVPNSWKYLSMAIEAAANVIEYIIDSKNPALPSCAPIRWQVRLVHASVFISKAILFSPLPDNCRSQASLIELLRKGAEFLKIYRPGMTMLNDGYASLLQTIANQLSPSDVPSHNNSEGGTPSEKDDDKASARNSTWTDNILQDAISPEVFNTLGPNPSDLDSIGPLLPSVEGSFPALNAFEDEDLLSMDHDYAYQRMWNDSEDF